MAGSGYPKGGYSPPMQQIPREKPSPNDWVTIGLIDRQHDEAARNEHVKVHPLSNDALYTLVQTTAPRLVKNLALILDEAAAQYRLGFHQRRLLAVGPNATASDQVQIILEGLERVFGGELIRFSNLIRPTGLSQQQMAFAVVQGMVAENVLIPQWHRQHGRDRWQDGSKQLYMALDEAELDVWEASRRLRFNDDH